MRSGDKGGREEENKKRKRGRTSWLGLTPTTSREDDVIKREKEEEENYFGLRKEERGRSGGWRRVAKCWKVDDQRVVPLTGTGPK